MYLVRLWIFEFWTLKCYMYGVPVLAILKRKISIVLIGVIIWCKCKKDAIYAHLRYYGN